MNKRYISAIGIGAVIIILIITIAVKYIMSPHQTDIDKSSTNYNKLLPKEETVILNENGFTPETVTIKAGDAVRWVNKSGNPQTVNSDNYPTNQLHKELNFGVFNNNSSVVYTFTQAGAYGYHNQFHHKQEGKVIVTR